MNPLDQVFDLIDGTGETSVEEAISGALRLAAAVDSDDDRASLVAALRQRYVECLRRSPQAAADYLFADTTTKRGLSKFLTGRPEYRKIRSKASSALDRPDETFANIAAIFTAVLLTLSRTAQDPEHGLNYAHSAFHLIRFRAIRTLLGQPDYLPLVIDQFGGELFKSFQPEFQAIAPGHPIADFVFDFDGFLLGDFEHSDHPILSRVYPRPDATWEQYIDELMSTVADTDAASAISHSQSPAADVHLHDLVYTLLRNSITVVGYADSDANQFVRRVWRPLCSSLSTKLTGDQSKIGIPRWLVTQSEDFERTYSKIGRPSYRVTYDVRLTARCYPDSSTIEVSAFTRAYLMSINTFLLSCSVDSLINGKSSLPEELLKSSLIPWLGALTDNVPISALPAFRPADIIDSSIVSLVSNIQVSFLIGHELGHLNAHGTTVSYSWDAEHEADCLSLDYLDEIAANYRPAYRRGYLGWRRLSLVWLFAIIHLEQLMIHRLVDRPLSTVQLESRLLNLMPRLKEGCLIAGLLEESSGVVLEDAYQKLESMDRTVLNEAIRRFADLRPVKRETNQ